MKSRWLAVVIVGMLAGTSQGQLRVKQWFTPSASHLAGAIVKALAQRGIVVETDDVKLLSKVVSAHPLPTLDIASVEVLPGDTHVRSIVRVACHKAGECLPFYAIVSGVGKTRVQDDVVLRKASGGVVREGGPILMRAGAKATLSMQDDLAHVQVAVISLESGAAGRTVRVRTPDNKQTYSAEIISADLLKGSF